MVSRSSETIIRDTEESNLGVRWGARADYTIRGHEATAPENSETRFGGPRSNCDGLTVTYGSGGFIDGNGGDPYGSPAAAVICTVGPVICTAVSVICTAVEVMLIAVVVMKAAVVVMRAAVVVMKVAVEVMSVAVEVARVAVGKVGIPAVVGGGSPARMRAWNTCGTHQAVLLDESL